MTENHVCDISPSNWAKLRDMYKIEWPKHILNYYTIHNYVRWFEQNVKMENIRVICLDNDWSDGTFIIVDDFYIQLGSLNKDDKRLHMLFSLLNLTDKSYRTFYASTHHSMIINHIKSLDLRIDNDYYGNLLCSRKENADLFNVEVPSGFHIKPLSLEHAKLVDSVWEYTSPPSTTKYIERMIKHNFGFGAFTEDGELVAWNLLLHYGAAGIAHTLKEYRQKYLFKAINITLLKVLAKNSMDMYSIISSNNTISNRSAKSIEAEIVGDCYVTRTSPRSKILSNL